MPVTIQSKLLNDLQAFQALICASLFVWLFTQVWVDSVTEITSEDLNAEDEDTIPEQMEYIITQPSNGHLALKTAPNRPIMNFTQAHIDQRQLLFVHSGEISLNNLTLFLYNVYLFFTLSDCFYKVCVIVFQPLDVSDVLWIIAQHCSSFSCPF